MIASKDTVSCINPGLELHALASSQSHIMCTNLDPSDQKPTDVPFYLTLIFAVFFPQNRGCSN